MNNKTLGTLAMIGAPCMLLGTLTEMAFPHLAQSWFTGVWGLLYITPWMGIMVAMHRAGVLGSTFLGRAMPWVLIVTLTLADISNLMYLPAAGNKPSYFFYIDLFWPISHVLMIVVGIVAIRAKVLLGWQRYVPLLMGLWLPFALGTLALLGRNTTSLLIGGLYNAIVVMLLAYIARTLPNKKAPHRAPLQSFQPVLQS